jgi:hypothetical protein
MPRSTKIGGGAHGFWKRGSCGLSICCEEIDDSVLDIAEPCDEGGSEGVREGGDALNRLHNRRNEADVAETQGTVRRERGRRCGRNEVGEYRQDLLCDEAQLLCRALLGVDPLVGDGIERLDSCE